MPGTFWGLIFLPRDWTHAPGSESVKSWPLDCQGSPHKVFRCLFWRHEGPISINNINDALTSYSFAPQKALLYLKPSCTGAKALYNNPLVFMSALFFQDPSQVFKINLSFPSENGIECSGNVWRIPSDRLHREPRCYRVRKRLDPPGLSLGHRDLGDLPACDQWPHSASQSSSTAFIWHILAQQSLVTVETDKDGFLRVYCRADKYGTYCQHFHTLDLLTDTLNYSWKYSPLLFGLGLRSFLDVVILSSHYQSMRIGARFRLSLLLGVILLFCLPKEIRRIPHDSPRLKNCGISEWEEP